MVDFSYKSLRQEDSLSRAKHENMGPVEELVFA